MIVCSWYLCAVRNNSALYNRTKKFGTFWEFEGAETAAESVEEDPSCSVKLRQLASGTDAWEMETYSYWRIDFIVVNKAGHVLDFRVIGLRDLWRWGTAEKWRHGGE